MTDTILFNGRISTLDPAHPAAAAVAIKDGLISAVGNDRAIMAARAPKTRLIDLRGRTVIPGLNDSHTHLIRGGLNYNMELRWEGVPSLSLALGMLRDQARRTPAPQWVRVVGGWSEFQFAERRMPTLAEINAAAPDTPVFVLHLYARAMLNAAALRAVGYTKDTPDPPGGVIERDAQGNPTGMLIAKPNAAILYATLAKGPKLPFEYQLNSTRHFMRELNRLGVTSVIDAGGGFQNYPDDYEVIEQLHRDDELTVRIAYNLFTQKPKGELADFQDWTTSVKPGEGDAMLPPQRRRRDARVLGRRFRGLSRAAPRPASHDGRGAVSGRAPARRETLAVPVARDLRPDDRARAGGVRARESRSPLRRVCTGSSIMRRRSRRAASSA